MYNEELKNRYLSTITAVRARIAAANTFDATAPFEEKFNTDVCRMNAEQLEQMLNATKVGMLSHSMGSRQVKLRNYVRWCIDNGVPDATDEIFKVETDRQDIEKWKRRTVRSPLHLQYTLDAIFSPESGCTSELTRRAYLWMAYSGIPEGEVADMTAKNFDFNNQVIRLKGLEYPIYKESLFSFKHCCEDTEFNMYSVTPQGDDMMWRRPRVPGDKILRAFGHPASLARNMQERVATANKAAVVAGKTDINLSYRRVAISGMFYRAYEREIAGIKPVFYTVAPNPENPRSLVLKNVEARKDYERWKLTLV